jgi:von Willebrand factor type A domain/Aerotolerance regulator N-terminal
MTLLAPWALWFLAIAGAVVALYLLKIKRRQATVPALDFWLALAGRTRVHSLFERLKRLLSMLLWLMIVVGLALALGNPIVSLGRVKPRAIAIVFDNSASMQTIEGNASVGSDAPRQTSAQNPFTRFALARKAVDDLTLHRPVTDQWLLIEAAREPRVLAPWTYDTRSVRAAAASIQPFGGSAELQPAIELAKQLLAGKPDPCIVVISDGAAGALQPLASADPTIIPWPIGAATDNLGIARLAVRADRQHGNYRALLSVVNASDQKIDSQVTLRINGSASSVELLSVEPRATWEKTITIEPTGDIARNGGVLHALIDRPDALPLDNEAFAILQPIRPAVVWLVSSPETAFFFEQALGAMDPLVSPEDSLTMSLDQYEALAAATAGASGQAPITPPDLVIFNNCSPPSLPAARHVIYLNAWPEQLQAPAAGSLEAPQLFLAPRPHALTDHVTLQGARLTKARKVTLAESGGARVLAQTAAGDPLIVLFEHPDRQSLCFAFDILDSDLPFRNAFPLMLRNAVAFMHEDAPPYLPPEVRIGETVRPARPLPLGATTAQLAVLRDGATREAPTPVSDRSFTFTDTASAGAIRLIAGEETSFAAISLADGAESRIAPIVLPPDQDPAVRLSLSRGLLAFGGVPWVTLVLLVTALVVLEWLTFHFRWTE